MRRASIPSIVATLSAHLSLVTVIPTREVGFSSALSFALPSVNTICGTLHDAQRRAKRCLTASCFACEYQAVSRHMQSSTDIM